MYTHGDNPLRGFGRALFVLVVCLIVLAFFVGKANAATTFTASATTADGQLATSLTWSSTQRDCVASGSPAWTGPKPSSGTETLPLISLSGTYTLTLSCSTPAVSSVTLTWTPPTQNTDGTPLTNLAGFRVLYGASESALGATIQVANPAVNAYVVENLSPGTWFFTVRAYNTAGAESANSNVASKTLAAGSTDSESVTLTVNPIPDAPSGLSAN